MEYTIVETRKGMQKHEQMLRVKIDQIGMQ